MLSDLCAFAISNQSKACDFECDVISCNWQRPIREDIAKYVELENREQGLTKVVPRLFSEEKWEQNSGLVDLVVAQPVLIAKR
jgi:hypothetical protein